MAGLLPLLAAVTLAIPVPVLSVTDGTLHAVVKLDDGGRYTYSYVNSIYEALVEERHVRLNDGLSVGTTLFALYFAAAGAQIPGTRFVLIPSIPSVDRRSRCLRST